MKVDVIRPSGYCLGVIEAINMSLKIRKENENNPIYVFGLLVHNDAVTKLLKGYNIETIDIRNIDIVKRLKNFKKDDIVIFTAHGHPKYYEDILNDNGVKFFDTTCVNVKKNIEIIESNSHNNQIIYIGYNGHPETNAAISRGSNVLLYEKNIPFDYSKVVSRNPIVINQTTLSFLELKEIHQDIISHIPGANIANEICNATRIRQENIIKIEDDVELIIIAGSPLSSNSRKLYEIAKNKHSDKMVIMCEDSNELKHNKNIRNINKAVIASGTSTSLDAINEIKRYLEEI